MSHLWELLSADLLLPSLVPGQVVVVIVRNSSCVSGIWLCVNWLPRWFRRTFCSSEGMNATVSILSTEEEKSSTGSRSSCLFFFPKWKNVNQQGSCLHLFGPRPAVTLTPTAELQQDDHTRNYCQTEAATVAFMYIFRHFQLTFSWVLLTFSLSAVQRLSESEAWSLTN